MVLVAAHQEAQRIGATLAALGRAFPGATLIVADDGSTDATQEIARRAGARVVGGTRRRGKGEAMSAAARHALALPGGSLFVLCDGDLGESASRLAPLADAVREGAAAMAVASFSHRRGGGVGIVLALARRGIRRGCGASMHAPLCGQRALSEAALRDVLPFAHGYGMEVAMTIDAVRAGHGVAELELDLSHREHGRTAAGFAHRARQLVDVARALHSRRGSRSSPEAARA